MIASNETSPAEPRQNYGPALPWARLMDEGDLNNFLTDLAGDAVMHFSQESTAADVLTQVEKSLATWRRIAEEQNRQALYAARTETPKAVTR